MLGALCVGCTKDNLQDYVNIEAVQSAVAYLVDGQQYYANPLTEEEWSAFYERMFALVEEGHSVRFWRNNVRTQISSTKVVETFSTPDKTKAEAWCKEKYDAGYTVSMTFNQQTGQYDCVAVK